MSKSDIKTLLKLLNIVNKIIFCKHQKNNISLAGRNT